MKLSQNVDFCSQKLTAKPGRDRVDYGKQIGQSMAVVKTVAQREPSLDDCCHELFFRFADF
jgi:hypothetical protein